jgi:hypothetical protein
MCKQFWLENLNERPLGIHRRRLKDNIRMDLREMRWEVTDLVIWPRIGASGGIL